MTIWIGRAFCCIAGFFWGTWCAENVQPAWVSFFAVLGGCEPILVTEACLVAVLNFVFPKGRAA